MDPRIAWYQPEQLGLAHDLWTQIWETRLGIPESMNLNNANPNLEQKAQEFIPLDFTNKLDHKQAPSNSEQNLHNQNNNRTRKRENRASTYGLNHSSTKHLLRDNGGLTPWKRPDKTYRPGPLG